MFFLSWGLYFGQCCNFFLKTWTSVSWVSVNWSLMSVSLELGIVPLKPLWHFLVNGVLSQHPPSPLLKPLVLDSVWHPCGETLCPQSERDGSQCVGSCQAAETWVMGRLHERIRLNVRRPAQREYSRSCTLARFMMGRAGCSALRVLARRDMFLQDQVNPEPPHTVKWFVVYFILWFLQRKDQHLTTSDAGGAGFFSQQNKLYVLPLKNINVLLQSLFKSLKNNFFDTIWCFYLIFLM